MRRQKRVIPFEEMVIEIVWMSVIHELFMMQIENVKLQELAKNHEFRLQEMNKRVEILDGNVEEFSKGFERLIRQIISEELAKFSKTIKT